MSKISAFRIANLNYNNNSMKIDDEVFEIGGESTLFSLRNGGGKTVLVQMMIAPFVNKRYRDLKDRSFNSYFTLPSPTYILTEWVLDGGIGHVLIGMMVKKRSYASDEDSSDELDIINFIYEYGKNPKYNIYNFPIIEQNEDKRKIMSFTSSKTLFENLKKDKDTIFDYFDMSVSTQARNYFDNLKNYKINNKEWESIIKKINMKESGLSELFQDSKNVSGLVEKWFIKTVEDKLNRDGDKIKNFSEIVKKYIYQYRDNQSKIDKKNSISEFEVCANNIIFAAEIFSKQRSSTNELKNKIANLMTFLRDTLKQQEDKKDNIEIAIINIKEYINEIRYEELSTEIHDNDDKAEEIKRETEKLHIEYKDMEDQKKIMQTKVHVLECAKIYEEYVKASRSVQRYENKIEIMKEKNENLKPERENIGFTLKKYYIQRNNEIIKLLDINEENICTTNLTIEDTKIIIDDTYKEIKERIKIEGELQNSINSFSKDEEKFNKRYGKELERGLIGYYTLNFMEKISLEYKSGLMDNENEITNNKKFFDEMSKELKSKMREKDDLVREISNITNEISNMKKQNEKFLQEIENRKNILKYVDVDESKFFNKEYIINVFNRKIYLLKEDEKNLNIRLNKLEDENKNLLNGSIIEIPKELEDKLRERDINIIYGMDWLKKNDRNEEENIKFIENNPFLPYSLIMAKDDLNKLQKENLGIFTNYPIPIITMDSLTSKISESLNGLCSLEKITFYLEFNNKLINEEELKKLQIKKQNEINSVNSALISKKEDIDFYEDKRNQIKFSDLNKENYDKLQKNLELKENEMVLNQNNLIKFIDDISQIDKNIDITDKKINNEEKKLDKLKSEAEDFEILREDYKIYITNKENIDKIKKELEILSNVKITKEKEKGNLENSLANFKEGLRDLKDKQNLTRENLSKYNQYDFGEIIQKDIEDLEARYDSLTKGISSDMQLMEEELNKASEEFKSKEDDLIYKNNQYNLKENDYKDVIYDRFKEKELVSSVISQTQLINKVNDNIHKMDLEYTKLKTYIESLYKKIKEDFRKELPKKKENILSRDFKNKIFENTNKLKEIEVEQLEILKTINIIENSLSDLQQFKDFNVTHQINTDVEIGTLDKYKGELQRDLRNSQNQESNKRLILGEEINNVSRKPSFMNDDFFMKSLNTIERSLDEPDIVIENLNITLDAHKALMEKLQADIELILAEKESVCQIIYEYIREVNDNIGKIDNNSSIKIRDKYVKMLNIKLPDWEINSDIYKIRVKDYLEILTQKALDKLQNNENIEELISNNINTKDLYNEVVSISKIDVKLYKIEEDKQVPISWNSVSQNSGGEGFLSAFVILSSLLSYMRRDETDIFASNEDGKVIIMDNPFAQTSSEHLLKPLMEIAQKSNTQLICFTGLGGDSIYNRFDNIYVLNLVQSKLKNSLKYLKSEHVKGEELTQSLVSSRFEVEDVDILQMKWS